MQITKFGHSCLLVEEAGVRLLTDPGGWSTVPTLSNIDAVLVTHEHADHVSIPTLQEILRDNPNALIITHEAVGKVLEAEGIGYTKIESGERVEVRDVSIESSGTDHEIIYGAVSPCKNTGYFIAEKLFVPGDALHDVPSKPVAILALPTGGPWMKFSDAIDYAKKLKPKVVFPIHDAMYIEGYAPVVKHHFTRTLEPEGIEFREISLGTIEEF